MSGSEPVKAGKLSSKHSIANWAQKRRGAGSGGYLPVAVPQKSSGIAIARVAALSDIALDGSVTVVDSLTLGLGDVVFCPAQSDPTENGLYVVPVTGGAWLRLSSDAQDWRLVIVRQGSDPGVVYRLASDTPLSVGVDDIVFTKVLVDGDGIQGSGTTGFSAVWTGTGEIGDGSIQDDGLGHVAIGDSPGVWLDPPVAVQLLLHSELADLVPAAAWLEKDDAEISALYAFTTGMEFALNAGSDGDGGAATFGSPNGTQEVVHISGNAVAAIKAILGSGFGLDLLQGNEESEATIFIQHTDAGNDAVGLRIYHSGTGKPIEAKILLTTSTQNAIHGVSAVGAGVRGECYSAGGYGMYANVVGSIAATAFAAAKDSTIFFSLTSDKVAKMACGQAVAVRVDTGATTLTVSDYEAIGNTASGAWKYTLPDNPLPGQTYWLHQRGSANTLSVGRSGSSSNTINGAGGDFNFPGNPSMIKVLFNSAATDWVIRVV